MEREDIIKFTNSVVLLSKLLIMTEDRFLKQKLHGKVSDFVSTFVEWNKKNVAQCRNKDLLNSVNNLLDYLEYLAHISKSNVTPLFLAQRNLLKFKLHILKQSKKTKDTTSDVANSAILISKPSTRTKSARLALKLNSNKERILNYIKKTPDVRTKDVMSEFGALSGRTVKRSLKELTDEGFLKKRSDGVAVYYTCG
ncbi:MAG: hypothetical protein A2750_04245 [Candidatus Yanofskybacteria bacterium RIFCSPHIGHO2_01_FULL_45_42]|uniref:HTH deoR-type domain-containing protein n=2 Tax=Candidatus Yanofskyibacteriota TaxID=1752733 RepID=A0A1F8FK79_9BACT|nr:MAG: hypothetical protein A2750_04245 [Candidatus Yanofskybacteria bacterium RIFCSPHIGHO2_01_FULL_45_42]OGN13472.1 MAG: hypothetical protein A3J47_03900 [Candidatus Yanofskybacteria bacterium RIFCSPHIGHO2_02_FULL_43_22]